MGLLAGDEQLVLEALCPELVRGSHRRSGATGRPASLSYRFGDDGDFGRPAIAIDYLCQGTKLGRGGVEGQGPKRSDGSDAQRAAVLRSLFTREAHALEVLQMLEEAGRDAFGVAPQGGFRPELLPALSPLHRAAISGSAHVLAAVAEVAHWRPWEVLDGVDAREDGAPYHPSQDLWQCRRMCLENAYSGFVVVGSWAYFCRQEASVLASCQVHRAGAELHLAPRNEGFMEFTRIARAGLILAYDPLGRSPMDTALQYGCGNTIQQLAWMGAQPSTAAEEKEKEILDRSLYGGLPQWLARAVGALPAASSFLGHAEEAPGSAEGIVLEDSQQIHKWMISDRTAVANVTGVSEAVAEALLRHHGHSVEAAIGAYRADPHGAKVAAHVPDDEASAPVPASTEDSTLHCGVCYCDLPQPIHAPPLWRQLPCGGKHPFCDDCLKHFVDGRLADGDVRGIVCPEPSCRLPLGEDVVERISGPEGRVRFTSIAASQAVDGSAHMAWCPQPGCGRAVVRSLGITVQCSCGFRFCSCCRWPEGHEPASCQDWEAWRAEFPDPQQRQLRRRDRAKADTQWLQRNAQSCPGCHAMVQRNGGCNHMICRCGMHFCYVCGRRWEEHLNQPGGLNFYECRLRATEPNARAAAAEQAAGEQATHVDRFDASMRSSEGARQWAQEAGALWESLHGMEPGTSSSSSSRGPGDLPRYLHDVVEEILLARQDLRFAAVFAWSASRANRETGALDFHLGELEAACATVEAALGPGFWAACESSTPQPTAVRARSGRSSASRKPVSDWPTQAVGESDLRKAAGRLRALSARLQDLKHLQQAVQRLRHKLLAGARNGEFQGAPPGLLGQLGRRVLSWFGF